MDLKQLEKIIALMEKSDLTELEVSEGDSRIYLSRLAPQATQVTAAPVVVKNSDIAPEPQPQDCNTTTGHILRAPMVGTFYKAPSPSSPPFVEIGQRVKAGDVLCIIEAMKMMNQITADKSGTLEAILVEDGQPVEFDQPLMTIV
ncbi:MAG: acetyl-CoA carboxylase biotin carboxyl carrier protein [Oceanospirillaceae bacterium]|nr:acetyl-CoA carboxylase biotin carboxyl carrier protein [Oceanospirillaceae bacterium]MCP5350925.1 acetyl-CoA carboxylase biotin carboxyl carrier protein [Oceanospirillaceae bacterium]